MPLYDFDFEANLVDVCISNRSGQETLRKASHVVEAAFHWIMASMAINTASKDIGDVHRQAPVHNTFTE